MSDCSVCCNFTHVTRMCNCKFCEFKSCEKCTKKYVLELAGGVKCMSCSKPWSRKDLVDMFGNYFVNKHYKARREELLFELEKALLPETQMWAVYQKNLNRLAKEIVETRHEIEQIQAEHTSIFRTYRADPVELRLEEWDLRQAIRDRIHREEVNISRREAEIEYMNAEMGMISSGRKRVQNAQNYKCSNSECKGFLSGGVWKCGMCETETCKKCHETVEVAHECDENNVATVELLAKDSKGCPKCAATIYKISGCSQMYCTLCHTAFEWGTLEIVTGIIHNPHYYEWLRKNGNADRQIGDIPCGGLPPASQFWRMPKKIVEAHRAAAHIEYIVFPQYRVNEDLALNRSLRVKYMIDEITETAFKAELQKREQAQEKKREISTIINTFLVVASDIFRRILDAKGVKGRDDAEFVKELEAIRAFTNEALIENVSRVYKCVVPIIKDDWQVESKKV